MGSQCSAETGRDLDPLCLKSNFGNCLEGGHDSPRTRVCGDREPPAASRTPAHVGMPMSPLPTPQSPSESPRVPLAGGEGSLFPWSVHPVSEQDVSHSRQRLWKAGVPSEAVGVGAFFEAGRNGGDIRIKGLTRGGPAEASGAVSVGDELLSVDSHSVRGRPLSELGQFVLGPPGSQVHLRLRRGAGGEEYGVFLQRGKNAIAPITISPGAGPHVSEAHGPTYI